MAWQIQYLDSTRKQLRRLDPQVGQRVIRFMGERIAGLDDAYALGRALTGAWSGYWRYRVGDYRVICLIRNEQMLIAVVKAGHRSNIYDQGPTAEILSFTRLVARESEEDEK